ncbi:MAG: 6,7-dimethyl-8-ribityllumazine synthase [Acidobacteria bacterium]|nr:6,7-dimethyl-8-ribityllumazine synthase [Acidobacteriota bacterium]MBI3654864.1 6,7-dimethyl-8-ribityllumazine synthase [Acidobacteriota bacterium]
MKTVQGGLSAAGSRFALVVSRFNDFIVSRLVEGAVDALTRTGAEEANLCIVKVPGSFEIPLVAKRLAESGKWDAIICLGVAIRGETPHFDYVAGEASKGIAACALQTGMPIIYGLVTAESAEQAMDRAGLKMGNKGFDAAMAAVEMVNLLKVLGK